jgi:hypothetical protein
VVVVLGVLVAVLAGSALVQLLLLCREPLTQLMLVLAVLAVQVLEPQEPQVLIVLFLPLYLLVAVVELEQLVQMERPVVLVAVQYQVEQLVLETHHQLHHRKETMVG